MFTRERSTANKNTANCNSSFIISMNQFTLGTSIIINQTTTCQDELQAVSKM